MADREIEPFLTNQSCNNSSGITTAADVPESRAKKSIFHFQLQKK
jgi:hypothetical protein